MTDIAEKRVYGSSAGAVTLYVACDLGVVAVHAADGRVGEFGVETRCAPRGIAAGGDLVAVATAGDVLVGPGPFEGAGFGPSTAVGVDGGRVVAAGPDGRVAASEGDGWVDLGTVDGVGAIDGGLLAAPSGVHRVVEGLPHVGLAAVRDVTEAGGPLAAAGDGLYALGNGWRRVLDGDWRVVTAAADGPAHAATATAFHERDGEAWAQVALPGDPRVVDVAYADCPYAVTAAGDLAARPDPGAWRVEPLGLDGVVGIATA